VTTHGSLALGQWEGGTLYFTSSSAAIFFDISQSAGMTNPMTTTGDTIYSSSGSTPARLGIGSTGQVLTVASGLPSWATPAGGGGKVLQVVSATYSTATTISSTSYTDTGLSLAITPTSATSKVLVLINQPHAVVRDTNAVGGYLQLLRGSTTVWEAIDATFTITASSTDTVLGLVSNISFLDSPATTSSTTYKTQGKATTTANNGNTRYQYDSRTSNIILMEIGA